MDIVDIKDQPTWDNFIKKHPEANFLQSWSWGEFHKSRQKTLIRRAFYHKRGQIMAAYEAVVETAKRGTYLSLAGGPIFDWSKTRLARKIFEDILTQAKLHRCAFIRIRPQLEDSPNARNIFGIAGFKPAPMYLSVELAGVLDLRKSEEEILASASQRLRRALRKAEKNHIEVKVSSDPKDMHDFHAIQLQTAKRHDFVAFSEDFLTKQFTAFAARGEAKLYTATYQGEILAQNFMIFYGNEASYHYGVSTELGTKMSSAPLLHMQAMRDARDLNIQRYNFWGITKEHENKHRFYGVSQFKRSFGVTELAYLPAHDYVINPLIYTFTYLLEKARRKYRNV